MARHFDFIKNTVLMPKVYDKIGYKATYLNSSNIAITIPVLFIDVNDIENIGDFKVNVHSSFIEFDYNDFIYKNYQNSGSNAHFITIPINVYINSGNYKFIKIIKIQDGQLCLAQLQPL